MNLVGSEPTPTPLRRFLASYWLTLCLTATALVLQAVGHINCDVSWLLTFAEKYLDGASPYVDITDPNPPLAFASLLPPIAAARAFGVASEPLLVIYVFLLAFASILLCRAVLKLGAPRARDEKLILLNSAVFLFLVTPGFAFGQREQLALLLMAPMFLLIAMREEGGQPSVALGATVGFLAGAAIGFKPFYIIPLFLPMAEMCWRRRSIAGFFAIESLSAAVGAAMQILGVLSFFPAYFADQLPGALRVYAQIRKPLSELLSSEPSMFCILLLAILPVAFKFAAEPAKGRGMPAPSRVGILGAAGFLLTFFLQGKGWINHAYPAVVLTLFAWIFAALDLQTRASGSIVGRLVPFLMAPAFTLAPLMFLVQVLALRLEEFPGLRDAMMEVAPPHPKIIALANQLVVGHPLSRQVGGEWVGRSSALWLSHAAAALLEKERDPAAREQLEAYFHRDLAGFAEDVRLRRPDVILIESSALREAAETWPETRGVLAGYTRARQVGEIEIWKRERE